MRNVWRLFRYDLKHLGANVVTVVIVLGLVFLPSIFTWYNVIACWNVFDQTGNLKVAVANADEGYESDLVPLEVNIGEQVVSALRANDQLDWVFTDEEDAIDGARSGEYYAAVVIPASFSQDMMSFYAPDSEHAQIVYYTNEKKNAVAPRVTDQGADKVAAQINQTFTETLTDVALAVATSLSTYAEDNDAGGHIASLSGSIADAGEKMGSVAGVLRSYAQLTSSAQSLVDGSVSLLSQARGAVGDAGEAVDAGAQGASGIAGALGTSTAALKAALEQSVASFDTVPSSIDAVYDSVDALSADSASQLRAQAEAVGAQAQGYTQAAEQLRAVQGGLPEASQGIVEAMASQMDQTASTLQALSTRLSRSADDVEAGRGDAAAARAEAKALAADASARIAVLRDDYANNLKPALDDLSSTVSSAVETLSARASLLDGVSTDLQGSAGSVSAKLATAKAEIESAAADMDAVAERLAAYSQRIDEALAAGDVGALKDAIGSDVESLAQAAAAPVGVERIAVFPVENFGSAMAPLYTTLALWVGALLMMVLLNPRVSDRARAQLDNPRPWQLFFGRYGVMAVVSLMQSTVVCLGNLFFLGVQVAHPLLYLLCFWVASLVFGFVVYTLVSLFANLGKAFAVLLLIIQVSGGGGSYPLQLLPEFFQAVSPYLPATHAINAMRAAMMGVYGNDFWIELGLLAAIAVPFVVLGLLRPVLAKPVEWYVEKVEESKLVS